MTDVFDRAAQRELELREDALREQSRAAAIGRASEWDRLSATHCTEDGCGEPIPEARRRALPGVQRCVDCQRELERGSKH